MVAGDKEPVYEFTLEDLGRFNEQPVLPFDAFGTLAWARSEFDNNNASSQVSHWAVITREMMHRITSIFVVPCSLRVWDLPCLEMVMIFIHH